jgi:flagellar protein FlbD
VAGSCQPSTTRAEDVAVIRVTRLNGEHFAVNPDLVERVEGHPDTVLSLVDGTKYVVAETVDEVLLEIRDYRASVLATAYQMDRGAYRPVPTPLKQQPDDDAVPTVLHFPTPHLHGGEER